MKYITILLMLILITSCDNSMSKLTVIKSNEILAQPRDTIIIASLDDPAIIYQINDDVILNQYQLRNHHSVSYAITPGETFITLVIWFIVVFFVGIILGKIS